MRRHPISALVRLLPALLWLAAMVITLAMAVSLYLQFGKAPVPLGFVIVAIYSARTAYKEYKEVLPALRADTLSAVGRVAVRAAYADREAAGRGNPASR